MMPPKVNNSPFCVEMFITTKVNGMIHLGQIRGKNYFYLPIILQNNDNPLIWFLFLYH